MDILNKYSFFRVKYFTITALIFLFVWLLSSIPYKLGLNDPFTNALIDFDAYDIVFSKMRPQVMSDTSIVIANVGFLKRKEIARMIERIEKENPKVVGLDLLFTGAEKEEDDSLLISILSSYNNCVIINQMSAFNESTETFDSISLPAIHFETRIKYGFANLPSSGDESRRTVRDFIPLAIVGKDTAYSFAAKIAGLYNQTLVRRIQERGKWREPINYRRNILELGYYFINYDQVLDTTIDLSFCKDKIVLFGFTGIDLQTKTFEDIFFTPLNENYAGKSFPDMYGVVIHANIISMINANDYINELPFILTLLIAFFICYTSIYLLHLLRSSYPNLYEALSKLYILLLVILYFFIAVYIFYLYNIKMNLTLTLISIFVLPTSIQIYENYLNPLFQKINAFKKKGVQI